MRVSRLIKRTTVLCTTDQCGCRLLLAVADVAIVLPVRDMHLVERILLARGVSRQRQMLVDTSARTRTSIEPTRHPKRIAVGKHTGAGQWPCRQCLVRGHASPVVFEPLIGHAFALESEAEWITAATVGWYLSLLKSRCLFYTVVSGTIQRESSGFVPSEKVLPDTKRRTRLLALLQQY